MRLMLFFCSITLLGCSAEPRSQSYFIANPQEADGVLALCRSGQHRGPECVSAEASIIDRERKARMEMARRGFREAW